MRGLSKPCIERRSILYRSTEQQLEFVEFSLPFGGKLNPENRWIRLARLIPWEEIEKDFAPRCFISKSGRPAFAMRLALGALIIKEHCGYSDAECVGQIAENPYLQFFCGLKAFSIEPPFDSSSMTHFRKRFPAEVLADINERIVTAHAMPTKEESSDSDDPDSPDGGKKNEPENRGEADR